MLIQRTIRWADVALAGAVVAVAIAAAPANAGTPVGTGEYEALSRARQRRQLHPAHAPVRVTVRDAGGLASVRVRRDLRRLLSSRHTIQIRVTDAAGNRRTISRSFRVCRRQVAPVAQLFTG